LTNLESFEDEAFNDDPPRQFGAVTAFYKESLDDVKLRISINEIFAQKKNLKHCIETVPARVSSVLAEASIAAGYRHLVLLRHNEIDRLISLEMARRTGAWGPEEAAIAYEEIRAGRRAMPPLNVTLMAEQAKSDAAALGRLVRMFMQAKVYPSYAFFEDLYVGDAATRCAAFRKVAEELGIPNASKLHDSVFHKAALDRGQDSRSMREFVPNLNEAIRTLEQFVR
jgi:hypothetical protein